MNIESVRADERLIHGQLINKWLHVLKPTRLLVCDDALMQMPFMANMYRSLVPIWLEARILSLEQTAEYLRLHAEGGDPPSACSRCNGCGAGNAAF